VNRRAPQGVADLDLLRIHAQPAQFSSSLARERSSLFSMFLEIVCLASALAFFVVLDWIVRRIEDHDPEGQR